MHHEKHISVGTELESATLLLIIVFQMVTFYKKMDT